MPTNMSTLLAAMIGAQKGSRADATRLADDLPLQVQGRKPFIIRVFIRQVAPGGRLLNNHGQVCAVQLLPTAGAEVTEEQVWDALQRPTHLAQQAAGRSVVVMNADQKLSRLSEERAENFLVVAKSGSNHNKGSDTYEVFMRALAAACAILYGMTPLPAPITRLLLEPARNCRLVFESVRGTAAIDNPNQGAPLAQQLKGLKGFQ